ncbi:MAG: hypothetical protein ACXVLX_00725 [Ilumatobacteraceae bacterium]
MIRCPRHAAPLVVTLLLSSVLAVSPVGTAARVHAAPPEHRVYMVTDSVGLGAKNALPAAFPPDWQVTLDGTPALFVEQLESKHVRTRMATDPGVFGDYAIVAGGYNYPFWDPARFDRSIDSMISALEQAGVKYIFWVTLREVKPQYITAGAWTQVQPYYWYFPTVNEHLRAAVSRHPDLSLIDWAAIADRPGLTYDAIHLNTFGASEYAGNIARVVMTAASRLQAGSTTTLKVAGTGGVPADATAVSLNLTVTNPRTPGFLTAYPCDQERPLVSNVDFRSDNTVAGAAIVPVAADGTVCVFTSAATHLIVDVMGSFSGTDAYIRAGPTRLTDTRDRGDAGQVTPQNPLRVQLPSSVSGGPVILNVTAIAGSLAGFVTVYRCGDPLPGTSNVNFPAEGVVPNLVVAQPDSSGAVCLFANQPTHLVVDLFGGLAATAVSLHAPVRAIDSRDNGGEPAAGSTVKASAGAPPGTTGVLLNVTTTQPANSGFLTAFPCDASVPPTSNLDVVPQQTVANFATIRPDATGNVCVYTSSAAQVIVDVMGTVGPAFVGLAVPTRAFDSRSA